MPRRRRSNEIFSLSFLDALTVGFGAIILLFVLSIGSGESGVENPVDEATLQKLREKLANLEADVAEKAAQLEAAIEDEETRRERQRILSEIREKESRLADLREEFESRRSALDSTRQEAAEARRLLESLPTEDTTPIGLPAEATHLAFVIDTSGSMRNRSNRRIIQAALDEMEQLLDTLPELEKIQFLDASGNYIVSNRAGFWLPDTPGLRQQALRQVRQYGFFSVSDPLPGIRTAFRDLRGGLSGEQKMALFFIGDDLHNSTQSFLFGLDRANPEDPATGERAATISAIGFPTMINPLGIGSPRGNAHFANAFRKVAEEHNGVLILKPQL